MTAKAIQIAVTKNIEQIFIDEKSVDQTIVVTKRKVDYVENDTECSDHEHENESQQIIDIKPKDVHYFDIIAQQGSTSTNCSIRSGWKDAVQEIITENINRCTKCVFTFNEANISNDEIETSGTCNKCETNVQVSTEKGRKQLRVRCQFGSEHR